jgi:hypothetical protein
VGFERKAPAAEQTSQFRGAVTQEVLEREVLAREG